MPLSRHNVGTYPETSAHATRQGTLSQSSQLADPLWTDPGLKSVINVRDLMSTYKKKKKKKTQEGNEWSNILPKLSLRGKKTPPPLPRILLFLISAFLSI